ncbi:MAG: cupin domain-containing protein [Chloroflexi bacterium]|nr:cupin domain-containing protein [Chloroflexota bacterium]MBT3670086.1 cupin domain-containing protein [Chloroflexota bacterium]MBT4306712.1 cupin domain-containing protein [Chloroflexota bacterium]MBT4532972.1 cupin domain-containing protein [Chloroflexota bacterium]MBT4682239.1 cupin domain-containing protein [Chloroflexota bacterium]
MPKIDLDQIEEREIVPGFHARFVHSENMTLAFWRVEAGASLPAHQHVHEQIANVLEGEFELTLDGETHHLKPGQALLIPSNMPHAGRAITECRLLDVFHPVREEYK